MVNKNIPNVVHQIWIQGEEHLPQKLKDKRTILKEANPGFEFILWDDKSIQEQLTEFPALLNIYMNLDKMVGKPTVFCSKSDIGRFYIVYKYGGWYMDIDFACSIYLDNLVPEQYDIACANNLYKILDRLPFIFKPKYCACFFGAKARHPVWNKVWKIIFATNDRDIVGQALDRALQENTSIKVFLIPSKKVATHATTIKSDECYSPKESSWVGGRQMLTQAGDHEAAVYSVGLALIALVVYALMFFLGRVRKLSRA